MRRFNLYPLFVVCLSSVGSAVEIDFPENLAQAGFVAKRIREACVGQTVPRLSLGLDSSIPAQGYTIRTQGNTLTVTGGDARGLMYGGLEVAERVDLGQDVTSLDITQQPFIKRRGLKMNIPLDESAQRRHLQLMLNWRHHCTLNRC